MNQTRSSTSLAELARCVRVEEGEHYDRLELASAWARMPEGASDRTVGLIGAALAGVLLILLLLQAALARSTPTLVLAMLALAALAYAGWYLRGWFWRTAVEVNAQRIRLAMQGWGTPRAVELPLDDIEALAYRMEQGRLAVLSLRHRGGHLPLPFSGQQDLDKLYCNILLRLLQKHRPEINFAAASETL